MQLKSALLIPAILFLVISCQSKTGDTETSKANETPTQASGLPVDRLNNLMANTDDIDIIFYNLPLSMSQTETSSIRQMIGFIAQPIDKDEVNCKSLGRLSFMSNGEIIEEAELYLDNNCQAFVFLDQNKPAYANAMSPSGVQFIGGIISKAQQQRQQLTQ